MTEFASSGISIWFFSRSDIPSAISNASDSIDTSGLGTPVAYWSSSGCDIAKFFDAQRLVFDITLVSAPFPHSRRLSEICTESTLTAVRRLGGKVFGACYNGMRGVER